MKTSSECYLHTVPWALYNSLSFWVISKASPRKKGIYGHLKEKHRDCVRSHFQQRWSQLALLWESGWERCATWLGFPELEENTLSSTAGLKRAQRQQKQSPARLPHSHLHTQMCWQYAEHTHRVHTHPVHTAHGLGSRKHRSQEGQERQEGWCVRKMLSRKQFS